MLDIGCGWGSLGLHAAREHNVRVLGITLSPPQAELANQRARDEGLADLARFEVADYRDLGDDEFDAVASIGMVEHVGPRQGDEYACQAARVLKPGGKVLNHGIAWIPTSRPAATSAGTSRSATSSPTQRSRTSGACRSRSRRRASRPSTSRTSIPTTPRRSATGPLASTRT